MSKAIILWVLVTYNIGPCGTPLVQDGPSFPSREFCEYYADRVKKKYYKEDNKFVTECVKVEGEME